MKEDQKESLWNSLEVTKILVGATTPLLIAIFGYQLSANSEARSEKLAQFERVTEKRVELWDQLGLKLNDIYAYLMYVGHWKELDAKAIVAKKREADQLVYSYKPFFSQEFFDAYQNYMNVSFKTFNGKGEDARPITTIWERDGEDDDLVAGFENPDDVHEAYYKLLGIVAHDFQLELETPEGRPSTRLEQSKNK